MYFRKHTPDGRLSDRQECAGLVTISLAQFHFIGLIICWLTAQRLADWVLPEASALVDDPHQDSVYYRLIVLSAD